MSTLSLSYIKEKWQHAGFQKYLRNTGWMFFGRFFTLGVSFFVGVYIARYLGPANYGLLNYVMSFVGLFAFLASFGIDGIVSREIIKNHERKDEIIGTAFYIKLVGGIIAILAVFFVSIFTTKDLFTLGLIWLFALNFIPQAFNIIEIYFQSQVLSKKVVTGQIIANIISTILKLVCIYFNKGIFWLTIIYIIETSIYSLILLVSFRNFGNHLRKWKFSTRVARDLLRDSWPLMLSTVAIGIYMKIDQVMIKNIMGNEQAGIYSAAVKLSEFWYFIPGIICGSVFPAIVRSKMTNINLYLHRIKKLNILMLSISILVALPITFFSKIIISTLFGNEYVLASTVLSIYVWSGISVSLNSSINQFLISENMTKLYFLSTFFGALLNIILNIFLIPPMGISGAATATVISYTATTLIIYLLTFLRYKKHE